MAGWFMKTVATPMTWDTSKWDSSETTVAMRMYPAFCIAHTNTTGSTIRAGHRWRYEQLGMARTELEDGCVPNFREEAKPVHGCARYTLFDFD
jgi:hypothetical protein